MDVIAMHQAGFTEAVASLGTALTSMQAGIIRKYAKEVILSYDSDAAGQKACMKNIGILREAGLPSRVLHLEPYKDPDEFLNNLGAEEIEKRIKSAEVSFFYEVSVLAKDYDLSDPAAKTAYLQDIGVRLSAFRNSLERETYLAAICERFSISKEALSGTVMENIRQGETEARKKDDYRDMYRSDMERILAENKDSSLGAETVLSSESKEFAVKPASVKEASQEQERKDFEFENYIVIEALFSTKGKALFQEISKYISPEEFIGSMRPLAELIWKAEGDWERYTPEEKKYFDEALVKLLQEKLNTWKPVGAVAVAAAFKDDTIRMASEERKEEEKIKKNKLAGFLKGILPDNW
jgi:DNA primase